MCHFGFNIVEAPFCFIYRSGLARQCPELGWWLCGDGDVGSFPFLLCIRRVLLSFLLVFTPWEGNSEGRSRHRRVLEIPHFTPAHISLARHRTYGHYLVQWKALVKVGMCSAENLGEGEYIIVGTVFADAYDFIIVFKRDLEILTF